MYTVLAEPRKNVIILNHQMVDPIVSLIDEYGGIAHIIKDDNCYVLLIGSDNHKNIPCKMSSHWFPEAAKALTMIISKE